MSHLDREEQLANEKKEAQQRTFIVSCVVCGDSIESSGQTREEAWHNLANNSLGPYGWKFYRRGWWLETFCPRHDLGDA